MRYRGLRPIAMASFAFALVAACETPGSTGPSTVHATGSVNMTSPNEVVAGQEFTISASGDTKIRHVQAVARGEDGSWVLSAAREGDPPSATRGEVKADSLSQPIDSLTLAFDPATTPGVYRLCVAAASGESSEIEDACVSMTVLEP